MPQGIVISRGVNSIALKVVYDAAVSHYSFYSSTIGPNANILMKLALANVANPGNTGGFAIFSVYTDANLKVLDPLRIWFIRITKKLSGTGSPESPVFSEPGTEIPTDGSVPVLKYLDNTGHFSVP